MEKINSMVEKNVDASSGVPVGSIIMWGGKNVPENWKLCDGAILEQETYSQLWGVIEHSFGRVKASASYDPDTQFYLPDLRGRFVRGLDNTNEMRDPDRKKRVDMQDSKNILGPQVGSLQDDDFRAHSHQIPNMIIDGWPPSGSSSYAEGSHYKLTAETGGNETRPVNAYLYFIIKVQNS